MDTKWKNAINELNELREFFLEIKEYLLGVVLICVGFLELEYNGMRYYQYAYSGEFFLLLFLNNVFLAAGIFLILRKYLNAKYKSWQPEGDSVYQEWKRETLRQGKKWLVIFTILTVISFAIDYWSGINFVLTITMLFQVAFSQVYFLRFMERKLNRIMEQADEMNRQKLEAALEIERQSLDKVSRSDQLRLDLITNVSHDLKTPITSMVGYLELMKKEELSDVVKDYVDVIVDKTDRLKEMIESLFSLAKVSSGNIELRKEKFGFNRLIEQIMADMKEQIDESELQFVTKLTKEDTEVYSDNMYCYRICQNLFENALKYAAKGTRVFVKTYRKDSGEVCLEMTNTAGYFMDFEKEEILEKFARGDKARSTEGNGLGLAIVSSYAKALGGEFDIQIDCDQFKAFVVLPRE